MIVRIFRVVTYEGQTAAFGQFFHETAIPLIKKQPGLVTLIPGAPRPETPNEFCMVMVWKDLDSLKAFAGEDWRSAHIHPDEAELVKERSLHHYELVEI
jgi:heme-degrading monooxygenase HmoA